MSNCSTIIDKSGDLTKTNIIKHTVKKMDDKILLIDSNLNKKISNIHQKFKGELHSKIYQLILENKKNIKTCVLERQSNDKDILKINSIIVTYQELCKGLEKRVQLLEGYVTELKNKQKKQVTEQELKIINEESIYSQSESIQADEESIQADEEAI